ncbi:MAG: DUF4179 domain-containing protein [Clostridium sp.]
MNNNDGQKLDINKIIIPDELGEVVTSSLKKGRRNRLKSKVKGGALSILILFLGFTIAVNTVDSVASAAYKIPWLRELTRLIDFDRGYESSVDKKLVEDIGFVETKGGVTLRVNTVVGDYKGLWVGYEVISDYEAEEAVSVSSPAMITYGSYLEDYSITDRYSFIGFETPVREFNIKFDIKNVKTQKVTAQFNVPIKLNENMLKSTLKKEDIQKVKVSTSLGDLELFDFESTITRTRVKVRLISDKYKYSGFENPRLIVDGKIHKRAPSHSLSGSEEYEVIEFQGGINGAKSIEFICDGVYYMYRDGNEIELDIKNKTIEKNKYNIEIGSITESEVILKTTQLKNISISFINTLDGYTKGERQWTCMGRDEFSNYPIEILFKIEKLCDKANIKVDWAVIGMTEEVRQIIR